MLYYVYDLKTLKQELKAKIKHEGKDILLVYYNSSVYALEDKCPHMGASLYHGDLIDGAMVCKAHKAKINVTNGEIISPAHIMFIKMQTKAAKTYKVNVKENKIFLDIE